MPRMEGMKASVYSQVILAKEPTVLPISGETVRRLFMLTQARMDIGPRPRTQAKPAFCTKVGVPAGILPNSQPLSLTSVIGSPPKAPNTLMVISMGISICIVVTPKLPRPAFRPSAVPCRRFGKKVLMFDIELAKLPPPTPDHSASIWKTQSGHSGCCRAMPVPMAGESSIAVVRKMVLRPPARRMKKDDGMRMVAPDRPEIAVSVNSSSLVKGKPRLSIWTEMIPHISQMAKPQSSAGIEIHRLRLAMRLPVDSQKASSSGRQSVRSVPLPAAGVFFELIETELIGTPWRSESFEVVGSDQLMLAAHQVGVADFG